MKKNLLKKLHIGKLYLKTWLFLLPVVFVTSALGENVLYLGKEVITLDNDKSESVVRYYCKERLIFVHIEQGENTMILPAVWSPENKLNKEGQVKCSEYYLWLDSIADE